MKKCGAFNEELISYMTFPPTDKRIARCYATPDREECHCGGDPAKCDFYESKRKEGEKMNTLEMMNEAKRTGKTYICEEIGSADMRYNTKYGFHDIDNEPWEGYALVYLNDLFAPKMQWQIIPDNCMTKAEAEAKFNIKIVG